MGKKDSSKTRVTPVFNELQARDPSGSGWIQRLLELPSRDGAHERPIVTPPLISGSLQYGKDEARLEPPRSLLCHMVEHATTLRWPKATDDLGVTTRQKRRALCDGDLATRKEALELLERGAPAQTWYVLEGRSRPDVYFETVDAIVVVEGKRTERHATDRTNWLRDRDQMLRHLDCAWERRREHRVYGFLVVEGKDDGRVPRKWREYAEKAVTADYLRNSLPHRDDATRAAIANAFLGVTTWQRLREEFGLANLED